MWCDVMWCEVVRNRVVWYGVVKEERREGERKEGGEEGVALKKEDLTKMVRENLSLRQFPPPNHAKNDKIGW